MSHLRRISLLGALLALAMLLGVAMPVQAAHAATPRRPACEQYYYKGVIPVPGKKDCTVRDVYDNFKKFADSYVKTTDVNYQRSAIPAMMYVVFGRYVVDEGKPQVKAINGVNLQYLDSVIVNGVNSGGMSAQAKNVCVRDNLLRYLTAAADRSNKVAKGYEFLEWTTGMSRYKRALRAGAPWASGYVQLVFASRGTTEYLGKTEQLRNATVGVGYNCFT